MIMPMHFQDVDVELKFIGCYAFCCRVPPRGKRVESGPGARRGFTMHPLAPRWSPRGHA